MTKEESVKKAWAEFYTSKVNENGWLDIKPQQYSNDELFDRLKFNSEKHSIRPKSLSGIETNNGWIKIESEEDLPKESIEYWVVLESGTITKASYLESRKVFFMFGNLKVTHYKRLEYPEPPIY